MSTPPEHPRYHLDRLIAVGGMGEVWSATDTLLDRVVAIKVLKREYAGDTVFRARFAAEARHAGGLQHPHVAAVLDYGEMVDAHGAPQPFLVMELVDGRPLSALLDGTPMEPERAVDLMAQAAEGIEAAHAVGIVHRDVKPGNLLVSESGQVKVTDFGIARAADAVPLTVSGHLVGTPHYLSPEQALGTMATRASDVYSLGIVLFECLAGRKPFVGDSPVATALMQMHEELPALGDAVPDRLERVARTATAKKPEERYQTAGAFAAALREAQAWAGVPDEPTVLAVASPPPPSGPAPRQRARRTPFLLLAVAAVLLAAVVTWAMVAPGGVR